MLHLSPWETASVPGGNDHAAAPASPAVVCITPSTVSVGTWPVSRSASWSPDCQVWGSAQLPGGLRLLCLCSWQEKPWTWNRSRREGENLCQRGQEGWPCFTAPTPPQLVHREAMCTTGCVPGPTRPPDLASHCQAQGLDSNPELGRSNYSSLRPLSGSSLRRMPIPGSRPTLCLAGSHHNQINCVCREPAFKYGQNWAPWLVV